MNFFDRHIGIESGRVRGLYRNSKVGVLDNGKGVLPRRGPWESPEVGASIRNWGCNSPPQRGRINSWVELSITRDMASKNPFFVSNFIKLIYILYMDSDGLTCNI